MSYPKSLSKEAVLIIKGVRFTPNRICYTAFCALVSYPDFVLTVVRLRVEVLCNRFNGSKLKPGPNSVRFVEEVLGALV